MLDYPNTSPEQHVTGRWNNYPNHWHIICRIIPTLVLNSMLPGVGIIIPTIAQCVNVALLTCSHLRDCCAGFQARSKDQEILEEGDGAGPSS